MGVVVLKNEPYYRGFMAARENYLQFVPKHPHGTRKHKNCAYKRKRRKGGKEEQE